MTKKAFQLEAVTDLKSGLLFGPEFLGLSRPATIGGVDVRVRIPAFEFINGENEAFRPRLPAAAKIDWVSHFTQAPHSEWHPFGKVTSWHPKKPNGGISEFNVNRLFFLSVAKATEAEAQKFLHGVDGWRDLLELWIEVVAKVDQQRSGVDVEQHGVGTRVWLQCAGPKGKKGKSVNCKHPISATVRKFPILPITHVEWREILRLASEGVEPPEVYVLLRDARRELNQKRFRRSVLDSATAAEVALAKLRDDALKPATPGVATYVQGRARQLGGLLEFHKVNKQSLPEGIQEEIALPRNQAIHSGAEPTGGAAGKCLKKAEEVVDLAFPHSQLLS
jgi:hypothetical protein